MQFSQTQQTFFAIIPPGLEQLAINEFERFTTKSNLQISSFEACEGGYEFICDLEVACLFTQYLKVPTKVLWRLKSFKCRDFPKLYNQLSKIRWSQFFYQIPQIKVSSSQSRLIHSERIAKSAQDAIAKSFHHWPAKKLKRDFISELYNLYIRLKHDLCHVSLDICGHEMFKRGQVLDRGRAPIRENLAAACINMAKQFHPDALTLLDPFCGSATIIQEWLAQELPHDLNFAWKNFAGIKISPTKISFPSSSFQALGNDIDQKRIEINQQSLPNIDFFHQDALELKLDRPIDIIVTNPPYNLRLKTQDSPGKWFQHTINYLCQQFQPKVAAFIMPRDFSIQAPKGYHHHELPFLNGGLKVKLYCALRDEK